MDLKHYLISPLYGEHKGLGKIYIFTGTHDICNPNVRKFKNMVGKEGIDLSFYEYLEKGLSVLEGSAYLKKDSILTN
jgi:acetyl esterase/lipase